MTSTSYTPESTDEFWAILKFRLLALGDDGRIETEIAKITNVWSEQYAADMHEAERFRQRLYNLVREGMVEDRETFARKHH
jgi:muramidase (phage lysozyme)